MTRKMGRPLAIEITDAHLKQIQTMAGYGLSVEMIAGVIGVSRATFFEYMKNDTRIKDAMESGRAIAASLVSEALFKKATGGDMRAIQWFEMTRLKISPDKPIDHDKLVEDVDLSQLEDEDLKALETILQKAAIKEDEAVEGEFEEEEEEEK